MIALGIREEKRRHVGLSSRQLLEVGDLTQDGCDYMERGDYEQAEKCFRRIVAVDDRSHLGWANIGAAYGGMGELFKAKTSLKKALSIKDDYQPAQTNLSSITTHYPERLEKTVERQFFEEISLTIHQTEYSVEPYLKASTRINVYDNLFELEGFYYDGWKSQKFAGAKGVCQHLSYLTYQYLSGLKIGRQWFNESYDIYFATGVFESRHFNSPAGNHICIIVFEGGQPEHDRGWIIDPSLKTVLRCFREPNCYRDIINRREVFTTNSDHLYIIPAEIGSFIRKKLEVKEDVFTSFAASFESLVPLFIDDDQSLVFAKFRQSKGQISVDYYEHPANAEYGRNLRISPGSAKYRKLNERHQVFSLINSLRKKVSVIGKSQADKHKRLISAELEDKHLNILCLIELAIVEAYRKNPALNDQTVARALRQFLSNQEDGSRAQRNEHSNTNGENIHERLVKQIESLKLEQKCSKRVLTKGLKQILESVEGFIQHDNSGHAYLTFVTGYFKD